MDSRIDDEGTLPTDSIIADIHYCIENCRVWAQSLTNRNTRDIYADALDMARTLRDTLSDSLDDHKLLGDLEAIEDITGEALEVPFGGPFLRRPEAAAAYEVAPVSNKKVPRDWRRELATFTMWQLLFGIVLKLESAIFGPVRDSIGAAVGVAKAAVGLCLTRIRTPIVNFVRYWYLKAWEVYSRVYEFASELMGYEQQPPDEDDEDAPPQRRDSQDSFDSADFVSTASGEISLIGRRSVATYDGYQLGDPIGDPIEAVPRRPAPEQPDAPAGPPPPPLPSRATVIESVRRRRGVSLMLRQTSDFCRWKAEFPQNEDSDWFRALRCQGWHALSFVSWLGFEVCDAISFLCRGFIDSRAFGFRGRGVRR